MALGQHTELLWKVWFDVADVWELSQLSDFGETMEKALRKQADGLMDRLEGGVTSVIGDKEKGLAERWEAFQQMVEGNVADNQLMQATDSVQNLANNATKTVRQTVEEQKKKVTEAFRETLGWKSFVFDMVEDAKQERGILATIKLVVWGWLANMFFQEEYDQYKSDISSITDQITSAAESVGGSASKLVDVAKRKAEEADKQRQEQERQRVEAEAHERSQVKKEAIFRTGSNLLIWLSGKEMDTLRWESAIKASFMDGNPEIKGSGLKDKTIEQLRAIKSTPVEKDKVLWVHKDSPKYSKILNELLESMTSNNVATLVGVWLDKQALEYIIKPKETMNLKLASYFWESQGAGEERLVDIFLASQKSDFDIEQELSFYELSILYLQTLPALRFPAVDGLKGLGSEMKEMMFVGSGASLETGMLPILSAKLLKNVAGWDPVTFGWKNRVNPSKDSDFREGVSSGLDEVEIAELDKLIAFKNYLQSPEFINNKKLKLSPEQKILFNNNLDYRWVVALYGVLWGQKNLDINPVNLPVLVYTIAKVIGFKSSLWDENANYEWGLYIGNYSKDVLLNGKESGLSDDEISVIEIYKDATIDLVLMKYINDWMSSIWGATGFTGTDLTTLSVVSLVGWFWLKGVWNKMIAAKMKSRGLSLSWIVAKKFWILGMLFWAVVGGIEIARWKFKIWWFARDIEEATSADEIIAVLKKHKEATKKYPGPNGKEVIVVAYEDDTPYVAYDGKIWEFSFIDTSGDPTTLWWDWDKVKAFGLAQWHGLIFSHATGSVEVNGKMVNTNIVKQKWDKVIFGNEPHIHTINLAELTDDFTVKEHENAIAWAKREAWLWPEKERDIPLEWKHSQYIELFNLWGEKRLALIAIGEVGEVFRDVVK